MKFYNYMSIHGVPVATHYYPFLFSINNKIKLPITEIIFNRILRLQLNVKLKKK